MNYYHKHLGDFTKDTAHLTALQVGIYNLLLDRYYASEKPIPKDEVYQVARCVTPEDRKETDKLLGKFFQRSGKSWRNKRCDEEIVRFHGKQEKARASANAMWEQKRTHSERIANAERTHSDGNALQYPISNLQDKEKNPEGLKSLFAGIRAGAEFDDRHTPSQAARIRATKT